MAFSSTVGRTDAAGNWTFQKDGGGAKGNQNRMALSRENPQDWSQSKTHEIKTKVYGSAPSKGSKKGTRTYGAAPSTPVDLDDIGLSRTMSNIAGVSNQGRQRDYVDAGPVSGLARNECIQTNSVTTTTPANAEGAYEDQLSAIEQEILALEIKKKQLQHEQQASQSPAPGAPARQGSEARCGHVLSDPGQGSMVTIGGVTTVEGISNEEGLDDSDEEEGGGKKTGTLQSTFHKRASMHATFQIRASRAGELRATFDSLDLNGDGQVKVLELQQYYHEKKGMTKKAAASKAAKELSVMDIDGNFVVTFDEYLSFHVFKDIDQEVLGFLNKKQLAKYLGALSTWSQEDINAAIQRMFKAADQTDGGSDTTITFREFLFYIRKHPDLKVTQSS